MNIYLACPYSGMEELSFALSNYVAGKLIAEGHCVYAPISMTHPISIQQSCNLKHEDWLRNDLPFIEWVDIVVIIKIKGWFQSKGVTAEADYATDIDKPVRFYDLVTGKIEFTLEDVKSGIAK